MQKPCEVSAAFKKKHTPEMHGFFIVFMWLLSNFQQNTGMGTKPIIFACSMNAAIVYQSDMDYHTWNGLMHTSIQFNIVKTASL